MTPRCQAQRGAKLIGALSTGRVILGVYDLKISIELKKFDNTNLVYSWSTWRTHTMGDHSKVKKYLFIHS